MKSHRKDELYVIDNFHPFPDLLRQHALKQEFEDWQGPDGEVYKRICRIQVPGILAMLTDLFGPVDMLGMGYRLNYNEEEPNAAIHSDLGWGTHALVLYLCEGSGGTAFWSHRVTEAHRIDPGDQVLFEHVAPDWNDESKWEIRQMVNLKYNRALIYESALFHSRYPFKAFGDSPENGRLIVVAFFTSENRK